MAAPKPVTDLMLSEKFGWTPQQIDDIPQKRMEEYMMILNARLNTSAEMEMKNNHLKDGKKGNVKTIGGGVYKRVPVDP